MSNSEKKSGMNKSPAKILQLNPSKPATPNPPVEETPKTAPETTAAKMPISKPITEKPIAPKSDSSPTPKMETGKASAGKVSIDPVRATATSRFSTKLKLSDDERYGKATKADGDLDGLLGTDIESRKGNYVFTVGRPQSGKSTMQSHLTRYLYQSGDYIPTPVKTSDEHAAQHAVSKDVLNEWQRRWLVNRFPERTISKHPSEYRFHMTPDKRRNKPLEFGYFEVAGEVYRRLLTTGTNKSELPESMYQFLSNQKCKFLFLFVCIGNEIDQDDLIFSAFLDYLHEKFGDRFMQQSHIGIVISDPTSAIELLKKRRADAGRSGKLNKQDFIREFLPTTTARLKGWGNDFALAQFHVGDVKLDEESSEPFIENPSFVDAKLVFNWIYECFQGVKPEPGPGVFERAQRWLAQFAE